MNTFVSSLWLLSAALFAIIPNANAQATHLQAMHVVMTGKTTRLMLDLSAPAVASVWPDDPRHLSVMLRRTALGPTLKQPPSSHPLISRIQSRQDGQGLHLTIGLKTSAQFRSYPEKKGARWVVELAPNAASLAKPPAPHSASGIRPKAARVAPQPKPHVVAIDAGHGGKDTGAIGPNGLREKDVVLAIARRLASMIQAEPSIKAVLVRKGDEFIHLRQRAEIARKAHADLFVSLHADAYIKDDVRGSSVFTLSQHGATSAAARWLADRENAADLVGGVKLAGKDKVLAAVLLDLSQNAALEAGDRAAVRILRELEKDHALHHRQVQKAGFVVLKSPDVPSLLVETAFISNPEEERKLASPQFQTRIARSLFNGIRAYFVGKATTALATTPSHDQPVVVAQP